MPREELPALADALHVTLSKLDEALERPAYNAMLMSNVLRDLDSPSWHWHLDVAPVLGRPAGFEWASGTFLNPTPPEEAAEFLRKTTAA
jgi:UDPglucose--hexose-1-phosphate uridylyltransferase